MEILNKGEVLIIQSGNSNFLLKVSLIQTTEQEALPPPELQSKITDILTASPNIAEAVSFVYSVYQ